MNRSEFMTAARWNFGKAGMRKAQKYMNENPKDEYTDTDYETCMYSDNRPGVNRGGGKWTGYENGRTTKRYTVYNSHD